MGLECDYGTVSTGQLSEYHKRRGFESIASRWSCVEARGLVCGKFFLALISPKLLCDENFAPSRVKRELTEAGVTFKLTFSPPRLKPSAVEYE
jgi:hypothetical protein